MIPSRTVSANCPALPRVMWPKYCSFSFATLSINSLSRPNSINNNNNNIIYKCLSRHKVFLPRNAKYFSPTPHFQSFYSVSVRFLQSPSLHSILPYWNTAHTIDFITLTFVAVFIFLSFQIMASATAFCLAIAMRLLISFVQSPSADLYDPRSLKLCTCYSDSPSWSTCTCHYQI